MKSPLLSPASASSYLSVSKHTLDNWRKKNKGPPYVRVEGLIMYLQSDLDDWIHKKRVDTDSVEE